MLCCENSVDDSASWNAVNRTGCPSVFEHIYWWLGSVTELVDNRFRYKQGTLLNSHSHFVTNLNNIAGGVVCFCMFVMLVFINELYRRHSSLKDLVTCIISLWVWFEDSVLLRCNSVSMGKWFLMFQRNLSTSFSRVGSSKMYHISEDLNPQHHQYRNLRSQVLICCELCLEMDVCIKLC